MVRPRISDPELGIFIVWCGGEESNLPALALGRYIIFKTIHLSFGSEISHQTSTGAHFHTNRMPF